MHFQVQEADVDVVMWIPNNFALYVRLRLSLVIALVASRQEYLSFPVPILIAICAFAFEFARLKFGFHKYL